MKPLPKDAHKDGILSQFSISYTGRERGLIGDLVFPNCRVINQTGYYLKHLKGAWFSDEATVRGPGADFPMSGYPIDTDSVYLCTERAFAHAVPIELINNADNPVKPLETGTKYATTKILIAKERAVSNLVVTASNWTNADDVTGGWAAGESNTFIEDVLTAKESMRKLIGMYPNRMMICAATMTELEQETDLLDRIKYTGSSERPARVTPTAIAELLGLDMVVIGGSIYSDAYETVAGDEWSAVDLWETNTGKGSALLYYAPGEPSIDEPSAGYTFTWAGDDGAPTTVINKDNFRSVVRWWEPMKKSWIVAASEYFDVRATCPDAGYLFYDTISD